MRCFFAVCQLAQVRRLDRATARSKNVLLENRSAVPFARNIVGVVELTTAAKA